MKISKVVPEAEVRSVEVKRFTQSKPGWYKVFLTIPIEIGEMTFDGLRTWVTDDGITLNYVRDVETYFRRRLEGDGTPLAPGQYSVRAKKIEQRHNMLIVKTTDGKEIVIHTKGKR